MGSDWTMFRRVAHRDAGLLSFDLLRSVQAGFGELSTVSISQTMSHFKKCLASDTLGNIPSPTMSSRLFRGRFCLVLFSLTILAVSYHSVDGATNFTIDGSDYDCSRDGQMICLGDTHTYRGLDPQKFSGILSLTHSDDFETPGYDAGIGYYSKPVRFKDPSTRRSASFSTSFTFYEVTKFYSDANGTYPIYGGDGMTFVISANNSTVGASAESFGFFDKSYQTSFKSVVVEFDSYQNVQSPINDISDNHVSLDLQNITAVVARNASDAVLSFDFSQKPIFAWIEYEAVTQILEVRISIASLRPTNPFLKYHFNLADYVEEYMWVGFTAANGGYFSAYYVGNWSFQSYGIPDSHPVSAEGKGGNKSDIAEKLSLGISVPFVSLMLILGIWVFRRRSLGLPIRPWRNVKNNLDKPIWSSAAVGRSEEGHRFSFKDLQVATRNFAHDLKLGQGGSGCVYRGKLPVSEFPVAVKRVASESKQGEKAFRAEVTIISQLRHRNLIQLLGWCIHEDNYYIVYDLMANGSLDKLLFRPNDDVEMPSPLSWPQRLTVIEGVAAAVEYLHNGWNWQVIHRDIKSSNIMLDNELSAKLGDFGLARLGDHQHTPCATVVAGTYGYIAPEAIASGRFTEKTDVFAFGALALEIACGRRSLLLTTRPEETLLVDWVWDCLSQGNLLSVVDQRLSEYDEVQMSNLLLLGLICSHPDPRARPAMRLVSQILHGEALLPQVPTCKPKMVYEGAMLDEDWKKIAEQRMADRCISSFGSISTNTLSR